MWTKIIGPTAFVLVLWVVFSGVTTSYIAWLYQSYGRVLEENVTAIQAAGEMQDILWRIQAAVAMAGSAPDDAARAQVAELEAVFGQHLEQAAVVTEDQTLVTNIRERFTAYLQRVHLHLSPRTAGAARTVPSIDWTVFLASSVAESCKQLLVANELQLGEATARIHRMATVITCVRMTFLVLGLLLGVALGLWVARGVQRSVSKISVILTDAAGKLEQEVGRLAIEPSGDLSELQHQVEAISTQIRQVIGQLHQARREAMQSERLAAVGELAAGVAHELRNPLTSVKLLVQAAAQRHPGRPLTDKQFHVLQEEIRRMEITIQGLIDFARPPKMHNVRHDLRQTVRRALNLVEGRAKQQKVSIEEAFPDMPVTVDGDPEQLHQVCVNLLLNGIEAMQAGGRLCVNLLVDRGVEPRCRVVFQDSGSGIPPPVLQRIFEPFVTTKERGTGLGLAVSQRIVREHDGKILATNHSGGGATFTIELPLAGQTDSQFSAFGNGAALAGTASHPAVASGQDAPDTGDPGRRCVE